MRPVCHQNLVFLALQSNEKMALIGIGTFLIATLYLVHVITSQVHKLVPNELVNMGRNPYNCLIPFNLIPLIKKV